MFLKASTTCKMRVLAATLLTVTACAPLQEGGSMRNSGGSPGVRNPFTVAPRVAPPQHIQSIQLYRAGSSSHAPLLILGKDQSLVLEFDHLGTTAKQFKASVQHYSSGWTNSRLSPNDYLDGFFEEYFGSGEISYVQRPAYRHYEYRFPNSRSSITASGNYLLKLHDADSGELLFSVPFFVSEDRGTLTTGVETLYAQRTDLRELDRLYSEYRYPTMVELPRFDLTFVYIQNRFWGRGRVVRQVDTSTPGAVTFQLMRDDAFLGDYEFNTVDIRRFSGERILSYQPEFTPPRIILRRDIQHVSPIPAFTPDSRFGHPVDDRNAQYADVHFRLDAGSPSDTLRKMFLVGDFNGWTISEKNRMKYDPVTRLWQGNAFIKQGEYAYKYVILDGNRIDDVALDRSFTYRRQHYTTLIYFRDPARHYDRLLKVEQLHY